MRIAIVDDLPSDCEKLYTDICKWASETRTPLEPLPELFSNGEELLENIEKTSYDIIFLDIYMTGITGMDTARAIRRANMDCRIIFTTQTPDFAVESYDVDSSYYLLKPCSYEKLSQALNRCRSFVQERERFIMIPCRDGRERLYLHNIAYTEYLNRRIVIHLKNGSQYTLSMRQADFADILLRYPFFCDCIRGVLVNFESVAKLERDRFLLKNGQYVPISRLKYQHVREKFLEYSYTATRGNRYV